MKDQGPVSTVVTGGDAAFAWGCLTLVASMRRQGMPQPVLVGAMGWPGAMKDRVLALGGVTVVDMPVGRRCAACLKPTLMAREEVETPWICWADADGAFVGDCSEWLVGGDPAEITVRRYDPPPPDFTPATLETWRRDVEAARGRALPESRYATRFNDPCVLIHRSRADFLHAWREQMDRVLPGDVGIVMSRGTAYFQTDESVLASLLCFDPGAPPVAAAYPANGSVDPTRYYAHFAYNPKPWRMWTAHASRWRGEVFAIADWLVERGIVRPSELPLPYRRSLWPLWRAVSPAAPWVWRAAKLRRKLLAR